VQCGPGGWFTPPTAEDEGGEGEGEDEGGEGEQSPPSYSHEATKHCESQVQTEIQLGGQEGAHPSGGGDGSPGGARGMCGMEHMSNTAAWAPKLNISQDSHWPSVRVPSS